MKGKFFRMNGSICNIPIESDSVCKTSLRAADSNGLVVVKLKRQMKYKGHVLFEPVHPGQVYDALYCLENSNRFYHDISIAKDA